MVSNPEFEKKINRSLDGTFAPKPGADTQPMDAELGDEEQQEPGTITPHDVERAERVLNDYMATAEWTATVETDEGLMTLDEAYPGGVPEWSEQARAQAREDLTSFLAANRDLIAKAKEIDDSYTDEQVAHDFSLTRNHHGVGFWDRGLGETGEALTEAAHGYGDLYLYVGDDGLLYT